jgi:hypothetical protein
MWAVCLLACRVCWGNLISEYDLFLYGAYEEGSLGTRADENSASPLNGQAAELWDSDPEEYKRQVLARHRDIDED